MNKGLKIFLIILVSLVVLGIAIGTFFTISLVNNKKESVTAEEFKNEMTTQGCNVVDATSQFASYNYVSKVYLASPNLSQYKVEFYELASDADATSFFNNNKAIFESSKGTNSFQNNVSINNYSRYELETNGQYMLLSRIDNTVAYVKVNSMYKEQIKDMLKNLDY